MRRKYTNISVYEQVFSKKIISFTDFFCFCAEISRIITIFARLIILKPYLLGVSNADGTQCEKKE